MKARNLFSKVLAVVLVAVMLLGLMPVFASAEETDTTATLDSENFYVTQALNSDMTLRKRATLETDGTYTIDLEAWATGDPIYATINNGVPTDIVVVVDQSGSMAFNASGNSTDTEADRRYTKLKTALNSFMQIILQNADDYDVDHRVALVGFASSASQGQSDSWEIEGIGVTSGSSTTSLVNTGVYKTDGTMVNYGSVSDDEYVAALVTVGQQNASGEYQKNADGTYVPATAFSSAVTNMKFSGGTNQHLGLEMAKNILDKRTATTFQDPFTGETKQRQTVVVIFADGESDNQTSAYEAAAAIKNAGTKIFSIALLDNGSTFMEYLSSNYNYSSTYTSTTLPEASYDNRNNTYYYLVDGTYYEVTQRGNQQNRRWEYTDATGEEKTLSEGETVYTLSVSHTSTGENKYYDYDANPDNLTEIFQTMSQEITAPGTDAPMDTTTIMRDILAEGFTFCEGWTAQKNVTVVEQAGGWNDTDTAIEWGDETTLWDENTSNVTVTATEEGKIEITGFDYCDKHIGTHAKGDGTAHDGARLKVQITGIVATDAAVTNSAIYTNGDSVNDINSQCGIFYTEETDSGSSYTYSILFGKPQTILTSESYVLDYAAPATMTSANWTSTRKYDTDMDPNSARAALDYGTVSEDGSTYTPATMNWDGYDTFYVLANTDTESVKALNANRNGFLWTKVNVIPANNVYYEDTFVTTQETDAAGNVTTHGTVGIVYTGTWTNPTGSNTEEAESDEDGAGKGVQGWEDSLAEDGIGDSDGTSHMANAGASATFTFTGTGVDIYTRTNMNSGRISLVLYSVSETDGVETATRMKSMVVDNEAVSGDYYQIPTASFTGLTHGKYKVVLRVTADDANNSTYYLDGIRIYNPLSSTVEDEEVVSDAYGAAELNAVFTEVRDKLIAAKDFDALDAATGVVFIDQIEDETTGNTTTEIGVYEDYGPKNEVYLAAGQSITFKVDYDGTQAYQVGLKAPEGATTALFSKDTASTNKAEIGHSADLYYKVTPVSADGTNYYITIMNNGTSLLSVTKIKTTTSGTEANPGIALLSITEDEAVAEVAAFSLRSTVAYSAEPETEETVPEETVPEETQPEEPQPEIDVEIQNPTEPVQPEEPQNPDRDEQIEQIKQLVNKIFNAFRGWFGR